MCVRPGKDFSRHQHFQKQEYFSFWLCQYLHSAILYITLEMLNEYKIRLEDIF